MAYLDFDGLEYYDGKLRPYDDLMSVITITDTATTLGSVASTLSSVNTAGDHVLFDVSALGANMYLCAIFIDTSENVYKIFDIVKGRICEGTYSSSTLLTMAIALASDVATQSQIDNLQEQIDELGGKSVIDNPEALGELIESGESTDVISVGDMMDFHWISSVLGTTTNGLTVACSDIGEFANAIGKAEDATYLFVYDGTNWTYDGATVDLTDYALTVSGTPATGEVMTIVTTAKAVSYTFTGYDDVDPVDASVSHNWLMEQTYAPATKVLDTYESLFCVQAGKSVPTGKYYLPMYSYRSGKTFNVCFELTSALGDSVKVQLRSTGYVNSAFEDTSGTSVSGVYAPSASLVPTVATTGASAGSSVARTILSNSDVQSGGYSLLTDLNTDADDPVVVVGNFDTCALGCNTTPYTNLMAWLNDDTQDDNWEPAHDNDVACSYNRSFGFLWGLDPRERALIQTAEVKWTAGYGNTSDFTQGTTYTAEADVFLLSMKEMGFNINTNEGNLTDLYSEYTEGVLTNNAVAARAKYNKAGGTLNSYRWSRSAHTGYANYSRIVSSTGSYDFSNAVYGFYFAPAFIIGKSAS